MTVNGFLTKTKIGLYCPAGDFYLDPSVGVKRALVSHAHGDHAVANHTEVYCTSPTKSIMDYRHGIKLLTEFKVVDYKTRFKVHDVDITFIPAGHMLGSAQILMEYSGDKYLYTGDFKIQGDGSCEAFEFQECDYLITETTFANPVYSHPNPIEVIQELVNENVNVVIGAYSVGKAQRITQLITNHFSEMPLFIHPEIIPYHQIYSKHGINLGQWRPYRRAEFKQQQQSFFIVSPSQFMRFSRNKNVLKVFATGWKNSYYSCDKILSISDHADWNDLLLLIKNSKAKKVFTVHGDGSDLINHFKGSDIAVEQLSK